MQSKFTLMMAMLFGVATLFAQSETRTSKSTKHNGLEVGLLGGSMLYTGDTHCEKFLLKQTNMAGGAFVKYYFTDQFSTRLNLTAGKIKGDDRNYPDAHGGRNFSFTNNILDLNAMLEWEPLAGKRFKNGGVFKRILSPYVNLGVGLINGKPTVNYSEANNAGIINFISADRANLKGSFFNIPFGAGLRYDLSPRLSIGLEGLMRKPFTDYLDGVSQAGNPNKKDWLYTGLLNVGYKFRYSRGRLRGFRSY